jgi:hypothetical protein
MSVRQGSIALAAFLGLAVWVAVGSLGLLALRTLWHDYALAEPLKLYTPAMLAARLVVATIANVVAGGYAARPAGPSGGWATGLLLLLLSVPVHVGVWGEYPVWYHIVYLTLLVPITAAAGSLRPLRLVEDRQLLRICRIGSGSRRVPSFHAVLHDGQS